MKMKKRREGVMINMCEYELEEREMNIGSGRMGVRD